MGADAVTLAPGDMAILLGRHREVLELVAGGAALGALLEHVTTSLEELIPGSRCSILLLSRDGRSLHHGASPSLPGAYSAAIDGIEVGELAGSCGTAAYTGRPVIARDIASDRRWVRYRELALRFGLRSCWSTPILGPSGRPVGTFAVYHGEAHEPTGRESVLVDWLTGLTSVAVAHAALYGVLAESEEKLRRAFEDNAVGMALLDLSGRVTRANQALAAMVGEPSVGLLGRDLGEWVVGGSRSAWGAALLGITGGVVESSTQQLELVSLDGRRLTVTATLSVVEDADGDPLYLSVNVLDITERLAAQEERRARREAEVARATAEEHNRTKSEFLTSFSHEMRSPLQAITGFTELLGTLELGDDRRQEALGHIDAAAGHLLSLVDDLLDIARLEARRLPLTLEAVELGEVVHEVVALLEPLATSRQVELLVGEHGPKSGSESGPASGPAWADRRRVRQVLLNLVANGIRYCRPGDVVTIACHGEAVGDGAAALTVRDDGPGIPASLLHRLYVPFDRLDAPDVGGSDGVGLGLRVSRGLCEAMGGSLSIASGEGVGTTATVLLPGAALTQSS